MSSFLWRGKGVGGVTGGEVIGTGGAGRWGAISGVPGGEVQGNGKTGRCEGVSGVPGEDESSSFFISSWNQFLSRKS